MPTLINTPACADETGTTASSRARRKNRTDWKRRMELSSLEPLPPLIPEQVTFLKTQPTGKVARAVFRSASCRPALWPIKLASNPP
jgi:hypothetical protein